MVLNDESEQFRQFTEADFDYPYERRQNVISKEELLLNMSSHSSYAVSFSVSDVCLEGDFTQQIAKVFGMEDKDDEPF